MRLGYKSQMLIDVLLASAADALDFASFPTRHLFASGGDDPTRLARQQLRRMSEDGWIVWDTSREDGRWVVKLTSAGKASATDDIDPESAWQRPWDGTWRMIAFDLPEQARSARRELDLWLRKRRFGRLQGSVWLTPVFESEWDAEVAKIKLRPNDISFFQGRSFARSSDRDFVAGAWDFKAINESYKALLGFLNSPSALPFKRWAEHETKLWRAAFQADPFLPEPLLPKGYLGKEAHRRRRAAYARWFQRPEELGH